MDEHARELIRLIDRRIDRRVGQAPALELVRGTVTAVTGSTFSATLDGSDTPTPGIGAIGVTLTVGDDVWIVRRRDGLHVLYGHV